MAKLKIPNLYYSKHGDRSLKTIKKSKHPKFLEFIYNNDKEIVEYYNSTGKFKEYEVSIEQMEEFLKELNLGTQTFITVHFDSNRMLCAIRPKPKINI